MKLPFPEKRKSPNMNKETVSNKEKYKNNKKSYLFVSLFVGRTPASWKFGRTGMSLK